MVMERSFGEITRRQIQYLHKLNVTLIQPKCHCLCSFVLGRWRFAIATAPAEFHRESSLDVELIAAFAANSSDCQSSDANISADDAKLPTELRESGERIEVNLMKNWVVNENFAFVVTDEPEHDADTEHNDEHAATTTAAWNTESIYESTGKQLVWLAQSLQFLFSILLFVSSCIKWISRHSSSRRRSKMFHFSRWTITIWCHHHWATQPIPSQHRTAFVAAATIQR